MKTASVDHIKASPAHACSSASSVRPMAAHTTPPSVRRRAASISDNGQPMTARGHHCPMVWLEGTTPAASRIPQTPTASSTIAIHTVPGFISWSSFDYSISIELTREKRGRSARRAGAFLGELLEHKEHVGVDRAVETLSALLAGDETGVPELLDVMRDRREGQVEALGDPGEAIARVLLRTAILG